MAATDAGLIQQGRHGGTLNPINLHSLDAGLLAAVDGDAGERAVGELGEEAAEGLVRAPVNRRGIEGKFQGVSVNTCPGAAAGIGLYVDPDAASRGLFRQVGQIQVLPAFGGAPVGALPAF